MKRFLISLIHMIWRYDDIVLAKKFTHSKDGFISHEEIASGLLYVLFYITIDLVPYSIRLILPVRLYLCVQWAIIIRSAHLCFPTPPSTSSPPSPLICSSSSHPSPPWCTTTETSHWWACWMGKWQPPAFLLVFVFGLFGWFDCFGWLGFSPYRVVTDKFQFSFEEITRLMLWVHYDDVKLYI